MCPDDTDVRPDGYGFPDGESFTYWHWRTDDNPARLWELVQDRATERKWRLYACACLRLAWGHLPHPDSRRAVEAAELYADGLITRTQKMPLHQRATIASHRYSRDPDPVLAAVQAAVYALDVEMRHYKFATLTRVAADPDARRAQADLFRDIFENPFHPPVVRREWLTDTVTGVAAGIYADRAFDRLPILADALEEAGCDDPDVLAHCRGGGPHARGCWVVDRVLGKS
jgi:hypothetical protein